MIITIIAMHTIVRDAFIIAIVKRRGIVESCLFGLYMEVRKVSFFYCDIETNANFLKTRFSL